jgi:hypothetical protein
MRATFGHDFSRVRVHTDRDAASSAETLNARAYTVGEHVVFGAGAYTPHTAAGRELLRHELAHTIQQGSLSAPPAELRLTAPSESAERTAISPDPRRGPLPHTGPQIARQPKEDGPSISQGAPHGSGREIRDWVMEQALETLSNVSPGDKIRMINSLLDWRVSDDDIEAIGKICRSVRTESEIAQIRRAISPRETELVDLGQRAQLRFILRRSVGTSAPPVSDPPVGGGGESGGGGASGSWEPEPAVKGGPLQFFHGTRWSIAKSIPNNVRPVGGGDFAAGFYTHHDASDARALGRAVTWARRIAMTPPTEKYAGVVRFGVPGSDYRRLLGGAHGKEFGLTNLAQPDYQTKQKEWLGFVTAHGRKAQPEFVAKRGEWVHPRRDPQPNLSYDVVSGPFYTPVKGTAKDQPKPAEFKPYAEGRALPQQVLWANEGIKLLNSNAVDKELMQYDAKTGKRQDPPVATVDPTPPDAKQLALAAEEAQFGMGP